MIKSITLVLLPEEAADRQAIDKAIVQQLQVKGITGFVIKKRSIDARSRQVKIQLQVDVFINESVKENVIAERRFQNVTNAKPIHIIGCGPAGLFAALRLIELGFKPIIIERGKDVKNRRRDLAAINKQGIVNPDSNYCFGEGGAGTYSDGKLYTRSGKRESIDRILSTFVQFGAHPDILIDAHPHIGTNKLPDIITAMREKIISCGGEILFGTRLTGLKTDVTGLGGIYIISVNGNNAATYIECDKLILATGHSARDVFELLKKEKILIEAKPFAIGVRIEHPQILIDHIQYRTSNRGDFLPPSSYSLVHQSGNKGVYNGHQT